MLAADSIHYMNWEQIKFNNSKLSLKAIINTRKTIVVNEASYSMLLLLKNKLEHHG